MDYVIISLHEKNFWQADVYLNMLDWPEEDESPDGFKTFSKGGTAEEAIGWAKTQHPKAKVYVSGYEAE